MGFCVAITMNASPNACRRASIVTERSFMASSRADCVLGGVRLISSASSTSVKMGPLVSTNSLVWKLKRLVPSRSPGIRSGVNWMRPNCKPSVAANAWASSVLAVPGTPSSRMCPPASRLVSIRSMAASWPTIALRTSSLIWSATLRVVAGSTAHLLPPGVDLLGLLFTGGGRRGPAGLGKPIEQAGHIQAARRAQLPSGIPHHGVEIALGQRFRVAPAVQQPRARLDQAALAGGDRRLYCGGHSEARGCGPGHQRDRQAHLDGDQHERKLEQYAQQMKGVRGESVHELVENHGPVAAGAQPFDHADRQHRIVAAVERVILDQVRVG